MPFRRSSRGIKTPKGSFPSLSEGSNGSFPSDSSTITTEEDVAKLSRRKHVPSYSLGTKYKFFKTCVKRNVSLGAGSNENKSPNGYSPEWAALMGLPSLEDDEVPLIEHMDDYKGGRYF